MFQALHTNDQYLCCSLFCLGHSQADPEFIIRRLNVDYLDCLHSIPKSAYSYWRDQLYTLPHQSISGCAGSFSATAFMHKSLLLLLLSSLSWSAK